MTETTTRRESAASAPPPAGDRPSMPNVLGLVITREINVRARNKGFVISTLASVAFIVGVIVVPTVLAGPTTHEVGVVGQGNAGIVEGATELANTTDTADVGAADDEPTSFDVTEYPDAASAEQALSDGEVDAVLVDGSEILVARTGGFGSSALTDLLQQAAGAQQLEQMVGPADAPDVRAALSGDALDVTPLSGEDAAATQGRTMLAYGGVFFTYLLIVQYGSWTMSSVTEEKANRVIEILLSAARPWQLFAGKVIGVALLGLGQFVVTVVAALTAIRVTGAFDLPVLPVGFAAVLMLWMLVGFAIYLVLFGSAGALAAKMEDAQSAVAPITMILIVGFIASINVLANPEGTLAVVGAFIPFLAPFVVPIRAALEAIPAWQHGLALVVNLAAIAGLTALSGRVYSGGALQFAGKLSWRQALRGSD